MHPILFSIGNFHFYTHGFLAALGIILGAILILFLSQKRESFNRSSFWQFSHQCSPGDNRGEASVLSTLYESVQECCGNIVFVARRDGFVWRLSFWRYYDLSSLARPETAGCKMVRYCQYWFFSWDCVLAESEIFLPEMWTELLTKFHFSSLLGSVNLVPVCFFWIDFVPFDRRGCINNIFEKQRQNKRRFSSLLFIFIFTV